MKHRHVFRSRDLAHARAGIALARVSGVEDTDIALVARPDIEMHGVPNRRKEADTDFMPAALKGALYGGLTGVAIGLVAMAIKPLHFGVVAVAVMAVCGVLVGAWVSSLVGSALPDPIRREFAKEIEAGHVLLLVDADEDLHRLVEPRLVEQGYVALGRAHLAPS
ncbi:hypothetical protein [Marilutibacter aestuarii]|uniref:DUF1269 domain-containing protein n=1 Tax=Marilutibacter aestuarii TaxID=1706195 RepID=A0A508A0B1_9GAMM|nr:hypothetical protein [Lysobacter aestuarii]TQD42193.1 hypothetical protein FKV25_12020 [Lysobacter aestuarii]